MKWKLQFSIIGLFVSVSVSAQITFPANLYFNSNITLKEGLVETGLSYPRKNIGSTDGKPVFTTFVRLPLTDKDKQVLVVDKNTQQWRLVNNIEWTNDQTGAEGPISVNRHSFQVEWGYGNFAYYPTGKKSAKSTHALNSFGAEWKSSFYNTEGTVSAPQSNFQFRLRYSSDAKEADKVGIVQPADVNGLVITKNLVLEAPKLEPKFMPAVLFQQYRGTGKLTFAEAIYYDFSGEKGSYNPFNGVQRARLEFWTFFYPNVNKQANVKIGLAPFVSVRTKGDDEENVVLYGVQFSFKVGGSFLRFF